MAKTTQTTDPATDEVVCGIAAIGLRLTAALRPFSDELQAILDGLEGQTLGRDSNKAAVAELVALLPRLGLRVRCPTCGQPGILRCRFTRNVKSGSFQFEHSGNGKQTNHGGGTTFPKLQLVPTPPDRRKVARKR